MVAVALGVVWGGYYAAMWGICLLRGYDVRFTQLAHTHWPGGASTSNAANLGGVVGRLAGGKVHDTPPVGQTVAKTAGGAVG